MSATQDSAPGHATERAPDHSPDAASDAAVGAAAARAEASLRRFTWLVLGSGAALLALGAAWRGVDFALGVLLGFGVVLLNFYWTKRAVRSVLFAGQPRSLLTLSYLLKFGLTAALLFALVVRLGVDALGVLVGLSALVLASVLFALQLALFRR
jgi:ATP synthase I chain